ncbi:ATP-grasp domain-containing protein [Aquisalinus flavus]|uniref:ATP-grasp domain-containing protein n=1 Tax=Aquisalinus flavus TaxID=1526572 RepID=A0A8J2V6M0_9PROT|nr:ATP-grasp domain-containing protein [Aquisalinus flavus]MBD0425570.1 ATP-grasp domain-containing protein [Aquisalinus flavus]UNE48806.1 ATP-grasp domain-containing protein [Aquisalinus flavus]GGD14997.1 hypothetical protein GCM10011342_24730 [Aquisalinus flavus]
MSKEKQPPAGRVIIPYGRSLMSLVAAHSLARQNIEVIGCDDVDFTVLSFSRYTSHNFVHANHDEEPEKFLDDMEKNIRKYKPEDDRPYILMPMFRETVLLAENKDRFAGLIEIAAPDGASIGMVSPKHKLVDTARDAGAAIPETRQPRDLDDFAAMLDDIPLPAVIKPVDGVGGRGISFCKTKEELDKGYRKLAGKETIMPLIQEAVDGSDYCMTGLFRDGELLAHMAYTNLQTFPKESGAGVMRETVEDDLFAEEVRKLMKPTGWTGVAEIDFRWTGKQEDRPKLIEVNPRFWAGLFQSVDSGVDYPWLLYQMIVTGEVPEHQEAEIGHKTRVPGFWAAEALIEAFDEEKDFSRVSAAWRKVKATFSDHQYQDTVKYLGALFSEATNLDDAAFVLKDRFHSAREAESELQLKKDPMTSLGVFYVLGSLIRHGKLPPEIKG